jgi:transposase
MVLDGGRGSSDGSPSPPPTGAGTHVTTHTRATPTGRKPLPERLPRVDVEVLPPEVQQQGTDAFERIGEDVTETVERRPASLVVGAYAQAEIRAQGPRAE